MMRTLYQQDIPTRNPESVFRCRKCLPDAPLAFVYRRRTGRLLISCRECRRFITALAIADRTVLFSAASIDKLLRNAALDPSFREEVRRIVANAASTNAQ
jgi:hypothetical protein